MSTTIMQDHLHRYEHAGPLYLKRRHESYTLQNELRVHVQPLSGDSSTDSYNESKRRTQFEQEHGKACPRPRPDPWIHPANQESGHITPLFTGATKRRPQGNAEPAVRSVLTCTSRLSGLSDRPVEIHTTPHYLYTIQQSYPLSPPRPFVNLLNLPVLNQLVTKDILVR